MVALSRGFPRPSRGDLLIIVVIGVLWFGVYNVALNEGEQRVDAGTAAMLIQVSPVLIALLAALFLGERFTVYLGLGLALAFSGVAVIAFSTSPGGNSDVVGVLLCLLAAVVYSISLVLQKPLVGRLAAVHVTWLACTVGAVACLPFAGQLVREAGDGAGVVAVVARLPRGVPDGDRLHDLRLRPEAHERQQPRGDDLPGPADHHRAGAGLPRRGAAHDGVRRRRARPGRRRRGAAQAAAEANGGRQPARGCHADPVNALSIVLVAVVAALHLVLPGARDVPVDHARPDAESSAPTPRSPSSPRRWPPTRASTTASSSPGSSGVWSPTTPTCCCSSPAAWSSPGSTAPRR